MRLPLPALAALLLLLGLLASPATALAGDPAFEPLQHRFQQLYRALQGKGGITEQDREVIREMRERFDEFNARNPGHEGGLAGELQLSMWLEDHDRADALFHQLVNAAPEKPNYGLAWVGYLERTGRAERVDEVYEWLIANTPDTAKLRMGRALQFKQRNEHSRAVAVLEDANFDPNEHAEGLRLYAECLFAENRFDEALAALNSISDEALARNTRLKNQVQSLRNEYQNVAELWAAEQEIRSAESAADDLPRVELVTSRGRIVLELFEDNAPNTVANFITLVEAGFYDNTRFHRIEPGFVTQGGDPNTKPDGEGDPGTGGPGYTIADEWEREGARKHFAGSLAMAHAGPNTAGSQFYITHVPTPFLNTGYTVFGRVIDGLDIARQMEVNDELEAARVLRKRDHEYSFRKFGDPVEVEKPEEEEPEIPELPGFIRPGQ